MKLTEEETQAIVALKEDRNFGLLMQGIARNCSADNERLIKAPEGNEYRRGQVFALSDLLETVNGAVKRLEQFRQPKK